ncbi:ATP-binding protein [Planomonospora algeriensis]
MQSTLVGRLGELDRLLAVLRAAAEGTAGVALVGGDAGIGKTRLVTELAERARAEGFAVLVGQCAELGDALPYLPLADALRGVRGELRAALDARPVLGRLLPGGTDAGPESASALTQQQLFGSVLGFLSAQPVLLILEDLHWADQSTRDLVVFLSRMLQGERVCLVGTYRTDDIHRRHPLRRVLAELKRLPSVTSVELSPLDRGEMADYVALLGGTDARMIDEVVDRAEGNPFYAEELLEAATEGCSMTDGLASLLLSRSELLSESAQRVLRGAAVAGRKADHDLLREASGLDDLAFEEAMREIVSRGLIRPSGEYGYAFRHALLQEAVYTDLLPGERTRLHAEFARLLTERNASAAELAHHYLAAHDLAGALAASVEAGRRAERLAPPRRRTATSSGHSVSGSGSPTPNGSPGRTTPASRCAPPPRRPTWATTTGRSRTCGRSRRRRRSANGSPTTSTTPARRRRRWRSPRRPSRRRRRGRCWAGPWRPSPGPSSGPRGTTKPSRWPGGPCRWPARPGPGTRRRAH